MQTDSGYYYCCCFFTVGGSGDDVLFSCLKTSSFKGMMQKV